MAYNVTILKTVCVDDIYLAAALFHEDVSVIKSFPTYSDHGLECLFPDSREVRQIVRKYKSGKLLVEPKKYMFELEHAEYTAAMLRQEIADKFGKRKNIKQ